MIKPVENLHGLSLIEDWIQHSQWLEQERDIALNSISAITAELEAMREGREAAIAIALQYGGTDGAHHKMWVIDQMLRILLTEDAYKETIDNACDGEDGPNTYEWDIGVAP